MANLFDSLSLGSISLNNRIIMAPLTRTRADEGRIPSELARQYYCQRSEAGLIITEGTAISPRGVGYSNTPGLWCQAQINGWKRITETVHRHGGKIFVQLWHVGRVSDPEFLNGEIPVAPSAIACEGHVNQLRPKRPFPTPRAIRSEEIASIVADYAQAARNAKEAGFDGVVVHSANGYLPDQFLHDGSNQRNDTYGGSLSNRLRFLLEVVDACIGIWGADRVGVNISPADPVHSMHDSSPKALYEAVATELGQRQIAFLFVREPFSSASLLPTIKQHFGGPVIANDGFTYESAQAVIEQGHADAVAFGRLFIANPDLPQRFAQQAPLNPADPSTFYGSGPQGYTDYPSLPQTQDA